jgi:hypothetical protein
MRPKCFTFPDTSRTRPPGAASAPPRWHPCRTGKPFRSAAGPGAPPGRGPARLGQPFDQFLGPAPAADQARETSSGPAARSRSNCCRRSMRTIATTALPWRVITTGSPDSAFRTHSATALAFTADTVVNAHLRTGQNDLVDLIGRVNGLCCPVFAERSSSIRLLRASGAYRLLDGRPRISRQRRGDRARVTPLAEFLRVSTHDARSL